MLFVHLGQNAFSMAQHNYDSIWANFKESVQFTRPTLKLILQTSCLFDCPIDTLGMTLPSHPLTGLQVTSFSGSPQLPLRSTGSTHMRTVLAPGWTWQASSYRLKVRTSSSCVNLVSAMMVRTFKFCHCVRGHLKFGSCIVRKGSSLTSNICFAQTFPRMKKRVAVSIRQSTRPSGVTLEHWVRVFLQSRLTP